MIWTRYIFIALLAKAACAASTLVVKSPQVTVTSSGGEVLSTESFSLSKPLSIPIAIGSTDVFRITFTIEDEKTGKAVQPHQTFLRFHNAETGEEGIQPMRVSSSGKVKYEINMARPPSSLPPTPAGSGSLSVSLLLGHSKYEPVSAKLFNLEVPVSYPSAEHPDEVKFHVLPEIVHTFRAPEKPPPTFVSMVGASLVLAPWLVLLQLWSYIPHSLPHIFSLNVLPFLLLLGAMEALLLWYWIELRIGQVLAYGALLGLFTAAAGNRALNTVAKWRLGKK